MRKTQLPNNGYGQKNKIEEQGIDGMVIKATGGGLFVVEILDGTGKSNGLRVMAYPAGKIKENHILITAKDHVKVEVCPEDPSKGRIIWRYK